MPGEPPTGGSGPALISTSDAKTSGAQHTEKFFYQPTVPSRASKTFLGRFALPKPKKVTIEEVPDDGSVQCFQPRSWCNSDVSSLHPMNFSEDADDISEISNAEEDRRTDDAAKILFHQYEFRDGVLQQALSVENAEDIVRDLLKLIKGESWGKGRGYKDPGFDPWLCYQLEGLQAFLKLYTNKQSITYDKWSAFTLQAVVTLDCGRYCARVLKVLACKFIEECTVLPVNPYGD